MSMNENPGPVDRYFYLPIERFVERWFGDNFLFALAAFYAAIAFVDSAARERDPDLFSVGLILLTLALGAQVEHRKFNRNRDRKEAAAVEEVTIIRAFDPDEGNAGEEIAVCAFTDRAEAHELREVCDKAEIKWAIETVRVDNADDKDAFIQEVEQ